MKNYYSTQGLFQQTIPQKPRPNIRSNVNDQFLKDDESLPDIPTPIDEDGDETLFNTSTRELNTVLPPQTCVKSKSDSLIQPESMTIVSNDRDIGEFIIHELIDNLSDICNVRNRFGYHIAAILRYSKMQQIMFPDHTKLRLTCLGKFDIFSNTERDEVIDKITTK
ncbi:hypothetical protein BGW36DRAFT_409193 [Talaromyces proteolyticus]|uniref:Uncharacterized protein n=1 Tax=Talaromyces proteolyticus TaxID=1131652 RepID=A0AAD4KQ56_9EURO|nr:uncharacterized protein BGW36DRAFT_409193 [Talaromyces proteolyticus]KAH8695693.1 hypothetical protein BGW36DRAFT_409193 [Talaromyces proteolyticus]